MLVVMRGGFHEHDAGEAIYSSLLLFCETDAGLPSCCLRSHAMQKKEFCLSLHACRCAACCLLCKHDEIYHFSG